MKNKHIVQLIKKSKDDKNMTMHNIDGKSKVSICRVNRIFAGEDVRFSSMAAVLEALDIDLSLTMKMAG